MTDLQELTADFRDLASQTEDALREQVRLGIEPLVLAAEELEHEMDKLLARIADLERQVAAPVLYEVRAIPDLDTLMNTLTDKADMHMWERDGTLIIQIPAGELHITAYVQAGPGRGNDA